MSAINAVDRRAARALALMQILQVPLHRSVEFRYALACLVISAAKKERCQTVRNGFEKAVVLNVILDLPPGKHQTVVRRSFQRIGVCHDALRLARMRRAAAAFAFRFLRARQEDREESKVEIQHETGGKAVLPPEFMAQPAINGLKTRLVLLAQTRLGRSDVAKHKPVPIRKDARW